MNGYICSDNKSTNQDNWNWHWVSLIHIRTHNTAYISLCSVTLNTSKSQWRSITAMISCIRQQEVTKVKRQGCKTTRVQSRTATTQQNQAAACTPHPHYTIRSTWTRPEVWCRARLAWMFGRIQWVIWIISNILSLASMASTCLTQIWTHFRTGHIAII